mmetsp:Transcript_32472/g.103382  ORF Transcript_32472/g.103382 Transcript_32472/m.103382 type:complete len:185 (-) Transcript_32472:162-716(-)
MLLEGLPPPHPPWPLHRYPAGSVLPQDNGHIPVKTEVQILDLLTRIKKKDPSIYKEEAKFFSDPEESDSEDGEPKKRKEKKLFLKDVVFKQAIEGAEAAGDSEEEEEEAPREPTYAEEQEALKRGFLTAAGDEEGTEAETWAGSGLQKRWAGLPRPPTGAMHSSPPQPRSLRPQANSRGSALYS